MAEEQMQEAPETGAVEAQARAGGWVPLEEWDGPENKWRSAEEFVEFGERVAPIVKKQRDELKLELAEIKRQLAGYKDTTTTIIKQATEKQKAEYEAQLNFLKTQLKSARAKGEFEVAAELEDALDDLREKQPEPVKAPEPVAQPNADMAAVEAWKADNPWFETDAVLTRFAIGVAQDLRIKGNTLGPAAFFKAVEKEVKEAFPEKFQKRRSAVESATPGANARKSNDTTYSNLPADAKAACDTFVEDKLGSRDDYLKLYNAAR